MKNLLQLEDFLLTYAGLSCVLTGEGDVCRKFTIPFCLKIFRTFSIFEVTRQHYMKFAELRANPA